MTCKDLPLNFSFLLKSAYELLGRAGTEPDLCHVYGLIVRGSKLLNNLLCLISNHRASYRERMPLVLVASIYSFLSAYERSSGKRVCRNWQNAITSRCCQGIFSQPEQTSNLRLTDTIDIDIYYPFFLRHNTLYYVNNDKTLGTMDFKNRAQPAEPVYDQSVRFSCARALTMDSEGFLYVTDNNENVFYVFNRDGVVIGRETVNECHGLAVVSWTMSRTFIFVCSCRSDTVEVFMRENEHIESMNMSSYVATPLPLGCYSGNKQIFVATNCGKTGPTITVLEYLYSEEGRKMALMETKTFYLKELVPACIEARSISVSFPRKKMYILDRAVGSIFVISFQGDYLGRLNVPEGVKSGLIYHDQLYVSSSKKIFVYSL